MKNRVGEGLFPGITVFILFAVFFPVAPNIISKIATTINTLAIVAFLYLSSDFFIEFIKEKKLIQFLINKKVVKSLIPFFKYFYFFIITPILWVAISNFNDFLISGGITVLLVCLIPSIFIGFFLMMV